MPGPGLLAVISGRARPVLIWAAASETVAWTRPWLRGHPRQRPALGSGRCARPAGRATTRQMPQLTDLVLARYASMPGQAEQILTELDSAVTRLPVCEHWTGCWATTFPTLLTAAIDARQVGSRACSTTRCSWTPAGLAAPLAGRCPRTACSSPRSPPPSPASYHPLLGRHDRRRAGHRQPPRRFAKQPVGPARGPGRREDALAAIEEAVTIRR